MTKIALGVSYKGSHYYGWQKQKHTDNTVQFHVEQALSYVANETIELICAGRTDSGVHGTGQVIHIDTHADRRMYSWMMGANTQLPGNIRINWAQVVDDDFHARFSATHRRYQYIIEDDSVGNAVLDGLITTCQFALDETVMHCAAQCLLGEQNFASFQASQCQSNSPYRHIDFINVYRNKQFVIIDIQANAFLYHMVRNIAGALLLIGRGKQPVEWLAKVLAKQDRTRSAATAPASGLYLIEVGYEKVYNIPVGGKPLPYVT